jgi:hypothetical protein
MDRKMLGESCLAVSIFCVLTCGAGESLESRASRATDPQAVIAGSNLVYVSDYFSFAGADAEGHVAFALDNNRGRDGAAYQAEHLVVMYDEAAGWVDAAGSGSFDNRNHDLLEIPDSQFFQFEGSPANGLTVTSPVNHLRLAIEPIPERAALGDANTIYRMGSAGATLRSGDRTIPGRVIYEYFVKAKYNRLTRIYVGGLKSFQGLYLLVGDADDFYVHRTEGDLAESFGSILAFAASDGATERPAELRFEVARRTFALGFYRRPTAWHATWKGPKGPGSLTLQATDTKQIKNWVVGGFAMSIVRGELAQDGRRLPIFGFAELIL